MDKKTLGIIKALKHKCTEASKLKDIVIDYMVNYSGCDRSVYTPDKVNNIIFEAFADFINTVDSPRQQLYQLRDSMRLNSQDYDVYDAMLSTMMLVEVRDGKSYVNGFSEDYDNN